MEERTLLILNHVESLLKVSKKEEAEYMLLHSLDIEQTYPQYMKLGYLYSVHMNRIEDALQAYNKALNIDENNTEAMALIAEMLYRLGRKREAHVKLLEVIKGKSNPYQYRAYFLLALLYQTWNRPERSLRFLNLSLKCKSDYLPAVKMLNLLKNKYLPTTAMPSG